MQNKKIKFKIDSPPAKYESFSFGASRFALQEGFTLLETVVALSIIVAAVIGPVTLITTGILDFGASRNKLIAANLAQEGIELVREVRDNNILCDKLNGGAPWDWNHDSDPNAGDLTSTSREADAVTMNTLTCGSAQIQSPKLNIYSGQPLRLDSTTGLYGYNGDQVTTFIRRIDIQSPPTNPDPDIPGSDQMDVIVTVAWQEHGFNPNLVIREKLYNWR